jgi:hypothetical protein
MDDQGRVDVTMRLAELEPGGYVLRLVVTDGERSVTREVGFVVR